MEKGQVTLTITSGKEGWSTDLATPSGKRFEKGHYANTQHAWFRDDQNPGIDISGQGRACRDNTGSFTTNRAEYFGGRLIRMVTIVQVCQDENIPISAELTFELSR